MALTINALKNEDVLIERKIGKSGLLFLNLTNTITYDYLHLSTNMILSNQIKSDLTLLTMGINDFNPFYSVVLFGSIVSGKQKKDSDLDIAIFIENNTQKKKVEAITNSIKLKSFCEMDVHVIPREEMLKMLNNSEENLGKQIARKHLSFYNNAIFYEILKEGIKNGFKI